MYHSIKIRIDQNDNKKNNKSSFKQLGLILFLENLKQPILGQIFHRYDSSVFRRSTLLIAFIIPAFLANLFVHFFATRILNSQNFGILYIAITLTNVLFSGSTLLHIVYTRYLIEVRQENGTKFSGQAMYQIQRFIALWGGSFSGAIFIVFALFGAPFGIHSDLLILMVVLDTYISYLTDLGRVYLQSMQKVFLLGMYTLIWMIIRLVLCLMGMKIFGTSWAVLLGSFLAGLVVFLGFQIYLRFEEKPESRTVMSLPSLKTLGSVFMGYGFVTIISNMDIFLTYFFLTGKDIGIYSASSVFPKGVLVVMTPIIQMLFGVMIKGKIAEEEFRRIVRKSFGVVLALTSVGTLFIWLTIPWTCGGVWGLHLCNASTLGVLLLTVVPLSLLRIAVVLDYVHGRDYLPLWLSLPVLMYMTVLWMVRPSIHGLANGFAVFSIGTLMFFLSVQKIDAQFRNRSETRTHESLPK